MATIHGGCEERLYHVWVSMKQRCMNPNNINYRNYGARGISVCDERLRELVRDYEHCTMHADCDKCEYDGKTSTHCPMSPCFPDFDELRELGVEVDE